MSKKQVDYTSINTYDTLNSISPSTKNIWIVFHGIGYLSKYFIRLFEDLDKDENYIIAPQAPSKYYKDDGYRRVGSSWLTKENTETDIENVLRYIDAVILSENLPDDVQLILLGYSQGVSIASRYIARRKFKCDHLILISGAFPKELTYKDFDFLPESTLISHIVGDNDPYFEKRNVIAEKERVSTILPRIKFYTHAGGHELHLPSVKAACNLVTE
ncbi:alpha/beta hydrolase [Aquimarina sp. W85]|uniref:alpha/beta hydrolase n=1 Tax=Aquimarina rhodophyticola TaxID=3342246 RepID=UPI00366B8268